MRLSCESRCSCRSVGARGFWATPNLGTASGLSMAIPRILHQTAPDDRGRWDPRWFLCQESWRRACPAPACKHLFWDDKGLRDAVKEAFPQHLATYDAYPEHIQRVDFARAALLFLHGGLYADMDVEARSSPFPYLEDQKVSIVASPYQRNEAQRVSNIHAKCGGHSFATHSTTIFPRGGETCTIAHRKYTDRIKCFEQ